MPKDIHMLVSMINMKLRDFYSNIDLLCDDFDITKEEIIGRLESAGYKYNSNIKFYRSDKKISTK